MPLSSPQDVLAEAPRTRTDVSEVDRTRYILVVLVLLGECPAGQGVHLRHLHCRSVQIESFVAKKNFLSLCNSTLITLKECQGSMHPRNTARTTLKTRSKYLFWKITDAMLSKGLLLVLASRKSWSGNWSNIVFAF